MELMSLHGTKETRLRQDSGSNNDRFVPKAAETPERLSGRSLRRLEVTIAYEKTFARKNIIGFGIKK
jgi:hypothetical protein